jgi:hypothetical protein
MVSEEIVLAGPLSDKKSVRFPPSAPVGGTQEVKIQIRTAGTAHRTIHAPRAGPLNSVFMRNLQREATP